MPNIKKNTNRIYTFYVGTLIFFSAVGNFLVNKNILPLDEFFQFSLGKYIVTQTAFPHTDFLTWLGAAEHLRVVAYQWLYNVFIFYFYSFFHNWDFLRFTVAASLFLSLSLASYIMWLKKINIKQVFWTVLTLSVLSFCSYAFFFQMRVQVLIMPLLLTIIILFEKRKLIWAVPLLMLLSVNIHSGMWPIFMLFIFFYSIKNSKYYWVIPVSFATVFLTPYPIGNFLLPFNFFLSKSSFSNFAEFLPFWELKNRMDSLAFMTLVIFHLFYLALLTHFCLNKNNKTTEKALMIVFAIYGMMAFRNIIFLTFVGLPLLSPEIKDTLTLLVSSYKFGASMEKRQWGKIIYPYVTFLFAATILFGLYSHTGTTDKKLLEGQDGISNTIISYMLDNHIEHFLNYTYATGGYLSYRGLLPMYDNRVDIFLPYANKKGFDFQKEYQDIKTVPGQLDSIIKKYKIKYMLITVDDFSKNNILNNPNYKILVGDKYNVLLQAD